MPMAGRCKTSVGTLTESLVYRLCIGSLTELVGRNGVRSLALLGSLPCKKSLMSFWERFGDVERSAYFRIDDGSL